MSDELELLPAVDIADGRAVRLLQGVSGTETPYGDPVKAAVQWQDAGAEWIHLVDLDAAFGRGNNRGLIAQVIDACNIKIELSGGIRDDASLSAAVNAGATRINLGTAALEDPEWTSGVIQEYGGLIAVGLDVRGENLAARGWVNEGGNVWEVLERLESDGCARYVVTDVSRDGTLQGPNIGLLEEVLKRTDKPVVASGGVSSLADIAALRALVPRGLEGAIVGKALYAGTFALQEAIKVASL